MRNLFILCAFFSAKVVYSQIGYGTNNPDPLSIIHLESSDKAFYLPRLTNTQIAAQTSWKAGMLVYNTDEGCLYRRSSTDWRCVDRASEPWFGTDNDSAATTNTENIYHSGNVGIKTNNPEYSVDVNGSFRNTGHGLFNVMNGTDGNMTGTNKRGIFIWNDTDVNWSIYMSRPGVGRAMDGGEAKRGNSSLTAHSIRFRAGIGFSQGFIFEGSDNRFLMSIRGSDGIINNNYLDVRTNQPDLTSKQTVVSDNNGHVVDNPFSIYNSGFRMSPTKKSIAKVYRMAVLKGSHESRQCNGSSTDNTFELNFDIVNGFSQVRSISPTASVNWTFSGSGTAADPWKASSPTMEFCWGNKVEITAESGTFQIRNTVNSQVWLLRMLIETW